MPTSKKKLAFDNNKYLKIQRQEILKRIKSFGGKLYLEFGGKLFDDFHASRVLPGFEPDSKLQMLLTLKDDAEIVMAVIALGYRKDDPKRPERRPFDEVVKFF